MSIEALCDQDTITVETLTATTGASFGVSESWGSSTIKRCLVQELDAAESLKYEAEGQRVTHLLFFSSDPSIGKSNRITLSSDWGSKILSVVGCYTEGRPGEQLLWIVKGEYESTRRET